MVNQPSVPRTRPGFNYTILGAVLALLGFGAVVLFGVLASGGSKEGPAAGPLQPVVVAARDIPIRTPISDKDLTVAKYAAADVPPGAFAKVADARGLVAAVEIKKSQPLTSNLLVKSGDAVLGAQSAYLPIAPGFVALTVPTGEQQGVAGYIQAGDYISVIAIVPTPGGKQNTRTVFTNVHVLRIGPADVDVQPAAASTSASSGPKQGGIASSLTIVLTQCQAEYMNWFLANAGVKYTLESYKDYKPQDVAVDTSCPAVTSAKGVTTQDVSSHWPGIFSP
jgi:Flp pilus assembly protein CpaB